MSDLIVRELLESTMQKIKTGIEQNMTNKRRNASGKSVLSLKYTIDGDLHAQLEGNVSFTWMEKGRKHGKIPMNFHLIILQWIRDKGISVTGDEKTAAWLIAQHIKDYGTKLNYTGGFDDIYTRLCNDAVTELNKKLGFWLYSMATDILSK